MSMRVKEKHIYSCAAVVALLIWIALFSAGLLMDSTPYRTRLADSPFSPLDFGAAMLLYTPSNVALLSIAAGFLGGCASRLAGPHDLADRLQSARAAGENDVVRALERRLHYLTESPATSMLRGFLVYLGAISGILLLIADPFKNPTAEQFIRTAGLISGLAFVMGYDPTRFESMIAKFLQWKPSENR
jgi:hypothetical protein